MIRLAQGKKTLPDDEMPADFEEVAGGDGNEVYNNFMSNAGGGFVAGFGVNGRPFNDPFKAI